MFIPTKRLMVAIAALGLSCNAYSAGAQMLTSDQNYPLSHHKLSLADLGIGVGSPAQFPANSCSQPRPEPPVKCDCTDSQGHGSPRSAACFSCFDPSTGQKCAGPYCQSCADVCSGVPPRSENICAPRP